MKKILSIMVLALLTVGVTNAQTADDIAKKYVEAIGGAKNWKALKSRKMTITLTQNGFDIPGYMIGDANNRERLNLEFQGMKMIQAFDGTTGWAMNQFGGQQSPEKLEGEQAAAMSDSRFLDEFIDYKKRGYSIALDGEGTVSGKTAHKIVLTKPSGNTSVYFFDKETGLMLGEEEKVGGQTILSVYSDHKEVEGLNIPMKITQMVGGVAAFYITITAVELNAEVADDMFAFPGK